MVGCVDYLDNLLYHHDIQDFLDTYDLCMYAMLTGIILLMLMHDIWSNLATNLSNILHNSDLVLGEHAQLTRGKTLFSLMGSLYQI